MQKATTIFARLSEVEKIKLRMASPSVVEHLANTSFVVDMPDLAFEDRTAVLTEVQAIAALAFASHSARTDYQPGLAF